MEDRGGSSGADPARHTISADELAVLWEGFRRGSKAICPRDGGALAVAVDAPAHAYRMICVRCGAATPWFESPPTGIRVRTGTSSMPSPRHSVSED
jgi:hypothetical protein